MRRPAEAFCFRQGLPFAFLLFQPGLSDEQTSIAEPAHEVRQVLMGLVLVAIRDWVRGTQWRMQMPGTCESFTCITSLVKVHMWVVFQVEGKHLLRKTGIWTANFPLASDFQAGNVARNRLTRNFKDI